jgi:hypothetical protein
MWSVIIIVRGISLIHCVTIHHCWILQAEAKSTNIWQFYRGLQNRNWISSWCVVWMIQRYFDNVRCVASSVSIRPGRKSKESALFHFNLWFQIFVAVTEEIDENYRSRYAVFGLRIDPWTSMLRSKLSTDTSHYLAADISLCVTFLLHEHEH